MCPHYGCPTCYPARRPNGALHFRCKACRKDFSLTSGTLFVFHTLPLRVYLAAIVIFCNEVKGKSALALSRDLGVQYKTAWVLAHKLREALASEVKGYKLGGVGKVVEVDGAYFGGYIKPTNHRENRRDRHLVRNQNGKRQCVVVIRQRDGQVMPAAFRSEAAAYSYIRSHVAAGTEIMADDASSWNDLHAHDVVKRINHELAYSMDGACTNGAESFFSRLRRAEQGRHHHTAGIYLARYAQESAWREGNAGRVTATKRAVWSSWRWRLEPAWTSAATGSAEGSALRNGENPLEGRNHRVRPSVYFGIRQTRPARRATPKDHAPRTT